MFIKKRRLCSLNCCEVPSAESSQTDLKQTQREKPPKLSSNLHPGGVDTGSLWIYRSHCSQILLRRALIIGVPLLPLRIWTATVLYIYYADAVFAVKWLPTDGEIIRAYWQSWSPTVCVCLPQWLLSQTLHHPEDMYVEMFASPPFFSPPCNDKHA